MTHPLQPEEEPSPPAEPDVIGLDEERTGRALDALSAETARRILTRLYEEPQTPTELQEAIGTSLQNVHYHLDNLEEAGLIQESGTRFSEKGNEMTVYGPASEAVVVMAGDADERSLLKRALARLVGALGLLAVGSFVVSQLFGGEETTTETTDGPSIAVESGGDAAAGAASGPDPALLFFVGGLFVIAVVGAWWLYGQYRAR
jgi:DNA-binding transcriptional ArsR family regulator